MTSAYRQQAITVVDPLARPEVTLRRRPRIVLLSLAVAILLLGAATAGLFGYRMISRGSAAAASSAPVR